MLKAIIAEARLFFKAEHRCGFPKKGMEFIFFLCIPSTVVHWRTEQLFYSVPRGTKRHKKGKTAP